MNYKKIAKQFSELIDSVNHIVVLQADNPDADSLATSLALEEILEEYGKTVYLYCGIDVPAHLRYLKGWDRVSKELPTNYDLAIAVDCGGARELFGNLVRIYGDQALDKSRLVIIDEHDVKHNLQAKLTIHDINAVSSGHIVYEVISNSSMKMTKQAADYIAISILADTLGLMSEVMKNNSRPLDIMAKLVEIGVDLSELQERRLQSLRISPELLSYKGELLQRIEYYANDRIASITIPYDELRERSQELNPTVVLDETRMVQGVAVSIGFKQYVSRGKLVRVTGRIRCNRGYAIAEKLSSQFGDGGGHPYAAGFKIEGDNLDFEDIKSRVIHTATELLNESPEQQTA